jgi:spermidine/putrescine transport system substrate-binding protein
MKKLLLACLALSGCSKADVPTLRVLTWADYFAADTIPAFEKEFGCRVSLDYIESSETLRTKLAGGVSGYDVVVPSDEVLADLARLGLLEPLDRSKLPGARNLSPDFLGLAHDPENRWSLPYMWGTSGIAYRKDKLPEAPDSWGAIWDPRWKDRVSLMDDAREAFMAAIRLDGAGDFSPESLSKAAKRFDGWTPLDWTSTPQDKLLQGDLWLAQCFSGDALSASEEAGGRIGFVVPKEGGTLWIDSLCVAKGSASPDLAHRFIDYLLRPGVSAAISNERRFANPNAAAKPLLRPELLADPLANPGPEERRRLKLLPVLDPERKKALDAAWAKVKRG